jgi:hypothetical protein
MAEFLITDEAYIKKGYDQLAFDKLKRLLRPIAEKYIVLGIWFFMAHLLL